MSEILEQIKTLGGEIIITILFIYYQIRRDKMTDSRLESMSRQQQDVANEGHKVAEGLAASLNDLRQEIRAFPARLLVLTKKD